MQSSDDSLDGFSLEGAYERLPVSLQHLAISLQGWRTRRERSGGDFLRLLAAAETRAGGSVERLGDFRDARVREFVRHAAESVPFYRRRFADLGVDPREIRGIDDLKALPLLTKTEVQDHGTKLLSESVRPRERIIAHSSGTTGGGLRFATTRQAVQEQWAIWWRYRRWHGIERNTWCATFGGRSIVPIDSTRAPFWRVNLPGKQVMFSGYHMSPAALPRYVDELRRRRLAWLHGYPSLLSLLASAVLEANGSLGYQVRWVTVGAENLLPHQASLIEQAFGVRPLQHYGMAEAVTNASQCLGGHLHVDEDFAATELVRDDHGRLRIIGTNLSNPATPLLRYDVGDVAAWGPECECGLPGRTLERIDGRLEDYVVLRDGTRVGRLDHVFKDIVNIREAQLVQSVPGEIQLRVVRGPAYSDSDEALLFTELRKRVGAGTSVTLEYVETLPRGAMGKLRLVVSELDEGRITPDNAPASSEVSQPL